MIEPGSVHSVHTIPTSIHGRYLVREPTQGGAAALLVGFHGYKENAEIQMERLVAIPGADRWTLVAVQGLHRFYRGRTEQVVASWMTREDRELAIDDNAAYVAAIVEAVATASGSTGPLVFAGFSQGVAMAFRAACRTGRSGLAGRRVSGVIAVGGDVPPELDRDALARASNVLLARGARDEWYTAEKQAADLLRLTESGVRVEAPVIDAHHEWTEAVAAVIGGFLATVQSSAALQLP